MATNLLEYKNVSKAFRIGGRKGLQVTVCSLESYLARQAVGSD